MNFELLFVTQMFLRDGNLVTMDSGNLFLEFLRDEQFLQAVEVDAKDEKLDLKDLFWEFPKNGHFFVVVKDPTVMTLKGGYWKEVLKLNCNSMVVTQGFL